MDSEQNPYATPQAPDITSSTNQVNEKSYYVEGKRLVVLNSAQLPNICIHTGVEMNDAKRRHATLYWASPWWALLIPVALLIYLIVYLCVRKEFTVHYSISKKALLKRRGIIAFLLLTLVGSIVGIFYSLSTEEETITNLTIGIGSIVALVISIIMVSYYSAHLRPKKHRDGWFTISGVSKEFLQKIS